jgi:hypothetical protein
MEIRDSLHHELVGEIDSSAFVGLLQVILQRKEDEVNLLREKIIKYEQKSRAEDVFYQSLSPIRKLFASRPPTHHRAVEYMVNVKDRMKKIESLKQQANELRELASWLEEHLPEHLTLSQSILDDIRPSFSKKEMLNRDASHR